MGSVSGINSLLSASTSSSVNLSSLLQAATGATTPGIDVNAAVQAAVYSAQAPERRWQAQQSTLTSQITALTGIQTALSSLSSDLNSLNDPEGPLTARATSSTSTAVSATAIAGSSVGTHAIAIQSLATAASWYSPALAATSSTGTSTLTINSPDGSSHAFPGAASLSTLAQSINTAGIGVTANVVTDATGSRLALVGSATGAASDFSVEYGVAGAASWSSADLPSASSTLSAGSFQVGDGVSSASITVSAGETLTGVAASINSRGLQLSATVTTTSSGTHLDITPQAGASVNVSNDPAFAFTRAGTAANASLTVDGVPVSSATNSVSGVIPGVTLQLGATTPAGTAVSLSVSPDSSAIQTALSKFVGDYNAALSAVSSQFSYSTATGSQGVLSGDSALRSLQSALLGVAGYTSGSSPAAAVQSLSDLGITMGADGSLSLDSSKLTTATANPSAVQNFFQGAALNGFAQQFQSQVAVFNSPSNGSIAQEIGNLNQQYTALGTQVTDYESGYIASQRTVLTAMYSKAEIALQQLPNEMKQIQAQLGGNSSGG